MLIIRKEQIAVFNAAGGGSFEDHLIAHFERIAPVQCQEMGDKRLRSLIRYGMERADNYDFTLRGPSRFYVETMFTLGSYFDTDPQYPWAFETLSDQAIRDEVERADALHSRLMAYVHAVAEPEMIHQAIHSMLKAFDQGLPHGHNLEGELLSLANTVYPEKFNHVGEVQLRLLFEDAENQGAYFDIYDEAGISLLFCLSYALGYCCAFDPLYPWISDCLTHTEPEARYFLLLEQSKLYLNRVLKNLGKDT